MFEHPSLYHLQFIPKDLVFQKTMKLCMYNYFAGNLTCKVVVNNYTPTLPFFFFNVFVPAPRIPKMFVKIKGKRNDSEKKLVFKSKSRIFPYIKKFFLGKILYTGGQKSYIF